MRRWRGTRFCTVGILNTVILLRCRGTNYSSRKEDSGVFLQSSQFSFSSTSFIHNINMSLKHWLSVAVDEANTCTIFSLIYWEFLIGWEECCPVHYVEDDEGEREEAPRPFVDEESHFSAVTEGDVLGRMRYMWPIWWPASSSERSTSSVRSLFEVNEFS